MLLNQQSSTKNVNSQIMFNLIINTRDKWPTSAQQCADVAVDVSVCTLGKNSNSNLF